MLLCEIKNRVSLSSGIVLSISILLFLLAPQQAYAQEEDLFGTTGDDSLLFGDEFDLGGDDFSFDFDEGGETDTTVAEEDDFFGGFDEEEVTEDEEPAEAEDDWGFGEDIVEADSTLEEEYPDHPLNFRKKFQGTMLDGAGFTLSFYSPQYVADKLNTWHSSMDYSLTIELPFHYDADPVNISFLIDISSFKFENSFPAGGDFTGISFMPMVRAEAGGFEAEIGAGMYSPSFGLMTGLGYALQYQSLFISAGYRWNWAYQIDPIGSSWWLEPRITMGIKLW